MTPQHTQHTVLIVDDEALFRTSVADALAVALPSYQVLQAANGSEALDRFDEATPDVIVTDINMPVMNGLELLLALRERRYRGAILVVTAFGTPRLETEVERQGAFGFHEKPVDLPQLIEAIQGAAEGECSHIEGLTLAGFAQLLELERKTCRLRVSQDTRHGDLSFRNGQLVDAKMDRLRGDEAARVILSWEEGARLDLHVGIKPQRKTISRSLSHLLLDAMQQLDEENRDRIETRDAGPDAQQEEQTHASDWRSSLREALAIEGAIGVALVDHEMGACLEHYGDSGTVDLNVASIGNTEVIRSKMKVMQDLGLDDSIEDILISLNKQYHLIRPLRSQTNLFFYLVLDRSLANLAMARHTLMAIERKLAL